jgi:integrase
VYQAAAYVSGSRPIWPQRVSEALGLTWSDVDLDRGVIVLDDNKTDEPRSWALDRGVAEALRRWHRVFSKRALRSGLVFVDPETGKRRNRFNAAKDLRRHLVLAGVERPQLFERSEVRVPMRAHDLRATFVTLALANGRTETWVADRTGHKSSAMINRYRRAARTATELNLGELLPLSDAIPELPDA